MNVIAVFDIAHPDLALTQTIMAVPEATIRVVRHSGTDPKTEQFFFSVTCDEDELEAAERELDADPTVRDWTRVGHFERNTLYRIEHTEETVLITPKATEVGGIMLDAQSNRKGWTVRLSLPNESAASTIWNYCRDEKMSVELRQLHRQDGPQLASGSNLTDAQRSALLMAYREGYFDEPRETSLKELAEKLEISPTAVGGRIRRGTARLVEFSLLEE